MSTKPNLLEDNSRIFSSSSLLIKKDKFGHPSQALVPKSARALLLDSFSIFLSKKSVQGKFTNFLNKQTKNDCCSVLTDLICDLKNFQFSKIKFELDENIDNMDCKNRERLCNILNLYSKVDISELSTINKAKVKTSFNLSTGFRIYFKITNQHYKIILLDPLHLAIPSRQQYKKGYRFEDYKVNNLCMNKNIIANDMILKRTYDDLKGLYEET